MMLPAPVQGGAKPDHWIRGKLDQSPGGAGFGPERRPGHRKQPAAPGASEFPMYHRLGRWSWPTPIRRESGESEAALYDIRIAVRIGLGCFPKQPPNELFHYQLGLRQWSRARWFSRSRPAMPDARQGRWGREQDVARLLERCRC